MTAAQTCTAMAAYRVDFINEHNRRGFGFGPLEQITHAARADTDEHLDKFRTGNAEEGHTRFARYRTRHQRLARPRRADHQHAFGNARTEADKFLRLLEELNDFRQFFFGFFRAS